jgi:hypothetical protein
VVSKFLESKAGYSTADAPEKQNATNHLPKETVSSGRMFGSKGYVALCNGLVAVAEVVCGNPLRLKGITRCCGLQSVFT